MKEIKLKILDREGHTLAAGPGGERATLVYTGEYREGDRVCIECDEPGGFCEIRLEDSMLPAIVYLARREVNFAIPFNERRICYSPKSFSGSRHLVTARLAPDILAYSRRNLALNPYDQQGDTGIYPHASANVETRGESVFAARNTVDGIFANHSHGEYPYGSWGINRRADAALRLDFGVPVAAEDRWLTLRADFPHDNYWAAATLEYSDGGNERVTLEKADAPQQLATTPRTIEWLVLKDLLQAPGPSPFPALTQIEVYGRPVRG